MTSSLKHDVQLTRASNFLLWSSTLRLNLEGFDLWGHLDGTSSAPLFDDSTTSSADSTATTQESEWHRVDRLVCAYIGGSVEHDICLEIY